MNNVKIASEILYILGVGVGLLSFGWIVVNAIPDMIDLSYNTVIKVSLFGWLLSLVILLFGFALFRLSVRIDRENRDKARLQK